MSVFFNISSLVLGLISWIIPIWSMIRKKKCFSCCGSFLCCALALQLQLSEIYHRVTIGDLSGVMDTINAIVLAGSVMLCVCVLVNLVVFLKRPKNN